jgi:hypothetical protein
VKRKAIIETLNDNELLELRFRELDLKIKGTWLEDRVKQLYSELGGKGLSFRPECFLADEWLTPDGEPVIGIAFYLAHPRLIRLERKMLKEAEGETRSYCMKLLRHEAGHAINYAYLLHRRKRWRELFGPFSADYADRYKYRVYSKRYVKNLDDYYAQYHPDEDFAETFAIWLTPSSNWRKKYEGWRAMEKLEYVDKLMKEITQKPPKKKHGRKYWAIDNMATTLKTYYKRKTDIYADQYPEFHDKVLLRLFPPAKSAGSRKVSTILSKYKKEIIANIALLTGEKKYLITQIMKNIILRAGELDLRSGMKEGEIIHRLTAYITTLAMNYYYTGTFKKLKK